MEIIDPAKFKITPGTQWTSFEKFIESPPKVGQLFLIGEEVDGDNLAELCKVTKLENETIPETTKVTFRRLSNWTESEVTRLTRKPLRNFFIFDR